MTESLRHDERRFRFSLRWLLLAFVPLALVLACCGGAWRYSFGDPANLVTVRIKGGESDRIVVWWPLGEIESEAVGFPHFYHYPPLPGGTVGPRLVPRGRLGSLDVLWSNSERYGVLVVVQDVHDPNGVFANSSGLVIALPDDGVVIEEDVLVYWLDAADVHVNRRFWGGADVVLDLDKSTLYAAPNASDFRLWGFDEWDVAKLVRIEAEARRRVDRKEWVGGPAEEKTAPARLQR